MQKTRFIFLLITLFFHLSLFAQSYNRAQYRVMFYNVENLFDTIDTPFKNDKEFLPEGTKHWNTYRYWQKINKTFQVIAAVGTNAPPEIIGLCEVESFSPLNNLIANTPLHNYPYSIVHNESPDSRGIDVALLFRNDKFKLLNKEFIEIVFPWSSRATTREILHACFQIQEDTVHIFVNHWPSRWGGLAKSDPKRMQASKILSDAINIVKNKKPNAKIIVLGDFNDEPHNNSIKQLANMTEMINLSEPLHEKCKCGTYRYKSEWNMLDQIFISKSLLKQERLQTSPDKINIFDADFLLTKDSTYGGVKPFRTYLGLRYIGGYSDHLPVTLDLDYKIKD